MVNIYEHIDEYDEYLFWKMEEDYRVAMELKPQRDLEELLVLDELFPLDDELFPE